jgi:hypothetical protein
VSLKFTDKNFKQPNCFWLSMHAYRILLPSETDDSRFNSREKHMLTDSVQPYNKPIIDLACEISDLFFAWTSLLRRSVHTKKPRSDISQYRPHARSISRYYYHIVCKNSLVGCLADIKHLKEKTLTWSVEMFFIFSSNSDTNHGSLCTF